MSDTSISVSDDQFSCSICLDLLNDPVTIPCGHSYCMNCITDYWNQDDQRIVCSCPQCRENFTSRPALNKNVLLAEMVEKMTNVQTANSELGFAGPGDVECDACPGRKRKAVKSCLLCIESYCQTHFDCHESHFSKRHKVTDATGQMKEMMCSQHERLLEVFCRTDQLCVCFECALDEHKNHDTVTAEAEKIEKQEQVGERVIILQKIILERVKKLQELRESVQTHRLSAQTAVEDSEKIFTELIRSIERRRSEVTQMIRGQEQQAVSRAEGHLKLLELEIEDLKKREAELKQLSNTDNHIHFLQNFYSLSVLPQSWNSYSSSVFRSYDDVRSSVSALKRKLENFCNLKIEKISTEGRYLTVNVVNPKTREDFLSYFHQFTLDLESVNKHFRLSEGNRVATCTTTVFPYPDHPNRFDVWPQVLCRESVFGRCYWEVEWSGTVAISVSYKTISRKGRGDYSKFGCNDQSWRLFCSPSVYLFSHNNNKSELPVPSSSSRIGVFVDHYAGILSFFSVSDELTLIHSVQTTFTQMLYPGFGMNQNSSVKLCHLAVGM